MERETEKMWDLKTITIQVIVEALGVTKRQINTETINLAVLAYMK